MKKWIDFELWSFCNSFLYLLIIALACIIVKGIDRFIFEISDWWIFLVYFLLTFLHHHLNFEPK